MPEARRHLSGPVRTRPDLFVSCTRQEPERLWIVRYPGCRNGYRLTENQFALLRSLADGRRPEPGTSHAALQQRLSDLHLLIPDDQTAAARDQQPPDGPVALAHWALSRYAAGRWAYVERAPASLKQSAGCYVCLSIDDRLRGCFGSLQPVLPSTAADIVQHTIAAACWDGRFLPLSPAEVPTVAITIDLVTSSEATTLNADRDPAVYGLQLRAGARVLATLLPGLAGVNSVRSQIELATIKAGLRGLPEDLVAERFTTRRLPAARPIPVEACPSAVADTCV